MLTCWLIDLTHFCQGRVTCNCLLKQSIYYIRTIFCTDYIELLYTKANIRFAKVSRMSMDLLWFSKPSHDALLGGF